MKSNLKFSTSLHSQTRKRNCLRWLSPFSSTANLFSLCRLSTGKNMRPLARWKKDESHYEGHCQRWRSLLQLPAGLDWWKLQPFSPGCFSRFSSFLGMDPQFQSQRWVSTRRMSLVFSFVNLCRLQMPLLKQHGQGGMHFKSFRALKKHPPLTLRQPMKAHFNGKGRPNDFFPQEDPSGLARGLQRCFCFRVFNGWWNQGCSFSSRMSTTRFTIFYFTL